MEARKAGLQDEMNDFEPDEERPMEIHKAWIEFGRPTSFSAFQTARKGKGPAVNMAQAFSQAEELPAPQQSTSAYKPDALTGALSEKFGLPEATLKAFSSKAVARAERLSGLTKNAPSGPKYKGLKGAAKEEVSALIDQTLTTLLQLSQKHGTDPTAATNLFQKKLKYFSSSTWDMWEMHHALTREEGENEEEACQSDDEVSEPNEDGSQSTSIIQITSIFAKLTDALVVQRPLGVRCDRSRKMPINTTRRKQRLSPLVQRLLRHGHWLLQPKGTIH